MSHHPGMRCGLFTGRLLPASSLLRLWRFASGFAHGHWLTCSHFACHGRAENIQTQISRLASWRAEAKPSNFKLVSNLGMVSSTSGWRAEESRCGLSNGERNKLLKLETTVHRLCNQYKSVCHATTLLAALWSLLRCLLFRYRYGKWANRERDLSLAESNDERGRA